MAQFVEVEIDIDGNKIKQFSSFSLSQSIFDHHSFRIVCPAEAIDGKSGVVFNNSKNLIGGKATIKIDAVGSKGTLQFTGVVTQLEAVRQSGHAGDIIISGFSPTILMDSGPHCKIWEEATVKTITDDVVKHFPKNLLQPKINPSYSETIEYTVQYKETAWEFLCRVGAMYGEWVFYDGQQLFMTPPQGDTVKLLYGSNLHHFSMCMQVKPAAFKMKAYDYTNSEVYDGSPAGIAGKAGLNELGKYALQKSEQFYASKPKDWHNQFLTTKKELDDVVSTRAVTQSSNMVRFSGSSDHPAIKIGGAVDIQGKNVFDNGNETFGAHTVIAISHQCDGQGNYTNDFIAIPSTIKMPPVKLFNEPFIETQSAVVTDNNDEKGLGRVRVKFHWMSNDEKSPWIRVMLPHAGNSKGMFIIPEIGEEVIVAFEGDNPIKPYVTGSVYHSKAKNDYANEGNDIKILRTRSGNKMVMNDKEGSVTISDKGGNYVKMDGGGNIYITAGESIVLSCDKAKIEMKKDGTITIDGKEITINATDKATMVSSEASFTADGQSNEASMEGMKSNINGTTETNINGLKTSISADTEVQVNGNTQTSIGASGMVAVKAPMITLN